MRWFLASIRIDDKLCSTELHQLQSAVMKIRKNVFYETYYDKNVAMFQIGSSKKPNIYCKDNFIVIGDIRIDNRNEIIANLLGDSVLFKQSDEALLIAIYEKLGEQCLKKIIGEFAFVLWDRQKKEVFAGRDQIGAKTIFWTKKEDNLLISSDIFLLNNHISRAKINNDYFREFIVYEGMVDSPLTPYKEVFRLPSASALYFSENKIQINSYWNIVENSSQIIYQSQHEYEEHFLAVFKEAVACRLSNSTTNAVMLSGGLDSTSIFAISKQLENEGLHSNTIAVSGVFEKYKESDEREFIEPLLRMYGTSPIYEKCDEHYFLKGFPNDSPWTDEPKVNSLFFAFTSSVMKKAYSVGAGNCITGFGGDHILGGSYLVIGDFFKKFQIKKAIQQTLAYAQATRMSIPTIIWKYGINPSIVHKELIANRDDQLIRNIQQLPFFHQKEFLRQTAGLREHLYLTRVIGPTIGIECQHPFIDRRVIEFLFRIPGEKLWNAGVTKLLLRKAMKNHLPPEILWRKNKTGHAQLSYRGLRENWKNLFPVLEKGRVVSLGFINRNEWLQLLNNLRQGMDGHSRTWLLIVLELWLFRLENEIEISII